MLIGINYFNHNICRLVLIILHHNFTFYSLSCGAEWDVSMYARYKMQSMFNDLVRMMDHNSNSVSCKIYDSVSLCCLVLHTIILQYVTTWLRIAGHDVV